MASVYIQPIRPPSVEPSSISCMLPMGWPITLRYITRLLTTNKLGNHPPKPALFTFFSMLLRASLRSFLYRRDSWCHSVRGLDQQIWLRLMKCRLPGCPVVVTEQHLARVILVRTSRQCHKESGQQANLMHINLLHRQAAPKHIFNMLMSTSCTSMWHQH